MVPYCITPYHIYMVLANPKYCINNQIAHRLDCHMLPCRRALRTQGIKDTSQGIMHHRALRTQDTGHMLPCRRALRTISGAAMTCCPFAWGTRHNLPEARNTICLRHVTQIAWGTRHNLREARDTNCLRHATQFAWGTRHKLREACDTICLRHATQSAWGTQHKLREARNTNCLRHATQFAWGTRHNLRHVRRSPRSMLALTPRTRMAMQTTGWWSACWF